MLKNKFFYIGLTIVTAIVILLLKNCRTSAAPIELTQTNTRSYIDPPFANISTPREVFNVNASKGGEFKYGTTKITVPECAFIDKDGNIVKGKVKLAYREVNDPISILTSGVPMETAEGSNQYLESAGMMEMVAWKGKEPLFVNPDCRISLNMQSSYPDANYNLYSLDTVNRKWVENKSNLPANQLKKEVESATQAPGYKEPNYGALAAKEGIIKPVKPVVKNKELFQFKFKTDFSQYPELNIYNGVQWEFVGKKDSENPAKNRWVTTATWNEMEIVKRKKNGVYKLRLASGGKVFNTTVKPVFDAQDMEYAEFVFNQAYDKYRTFVDNKKEEARQWRLKQERLDKERAQREKVYELTGKFSREFKVQSFGWANLDRIYNIEPQQIMASFIDKNGDRLPVKTVYLIMDSVNSILSFPSYNLDNFKFDPKSKNSLIVVDSLAQAYVIGNEEFERINSVAKKHQFKVDEPVKVESESDIRKLLKNV